LTEDPGERQRVTAPSDWQRWVEGVDWSDWRGWLQRVASTNWAQGQTASPPWAGPPRAEAVSLTLRAMEEDQPGNRIREHLAATWPAFRRWWRDGPHGRPPVDEARARLHAHMPELVPTWERLTAMLPGVSEAGSALALWNPPPFLTGCSQAVVLPGGPALIRNYDWDYRLFDAVVARTAYTGRTVLGMLDCLWGLLDGVNDDGLAVSLTFGGRPQVGEGFGIPLVIRYVLEVCGTVAEAVDVLRRVPVHMSYNVTALDRAGGWATVYVAPDRPARVTARAVTTNHQGTVEWEPYATTIRSVERAERLEELLADGADVAGVVAACLRSPLYASRFHEGFGTLYTAEYRPVEGIARYHWPGRVWEHSLQKVSDESPHLDLGITGPDIGGDASRRAQAW
jgi:predicted choloylglycine hydrolase